VHASTQLFELVPQYAVRCRQDRARDVVVAQHVAQELLQVQLPAAEAEVVRGDKQVHSVGVRTVTAGQNRRSRPQDVRALRFGHRPFLAPVPQGAVTEAEPTSALAHGVHNQADVTPVSRLERDEDLPPCEWRIRVADLRGDVRPRIGQQSCPYRRGSVDRDLDTVVPTAGEKPAACDQEVVDDAAVHRLLDSARRDGRGEIHHTRLKDLRQAVAAQDERTDTVGAGVDQLPVEGRAPSRGR
jgi:hypothetical protein